MQTMPNTVSQLRREAKTRGLFLPVLDTAATLDQPETLHGFTVANRRSIQMDSVWDTAAGTPTAETVSRYVSCISNGYGLLWSEPMAICTDGKRHENQLCLCEETLPAIREMVQTMRQAAPGGHPPLLIALLDHAGRYALTPQPVDHCPHPDAEAGGNMPLITDETLGRLIVTAGEAARLAEAAGFDGIAFNAAARSLFGESLAACSRHGIFGGDFNDRTRFLRDCYTAAKHTVKNAFLCIRLNLFNGMEPPFGWGVAFEDVSAPDISEPALLLRVLHELYDVVLAACDVSAPVGRDEHPLAHISRLCTCIAMADSALQQNVRLVVPPCADLQQLAPNVGAAMIAEHFASFAAM